MKKNKRKETYEAYCERCRKNSIEPLPRIKWEALHDIRNFKFLC